MMMQNLAAFVVAAILEILGCFTFWLWLRRGASPAIAALGILSLIGFAVALTRVDAAFAGRSYAAYGGIYIAASLAWLWLVEGQQPTSSDMIGAGLPSLAPSLSWDTRHERERAVGLVVCAGRRNEAPCG
jgi:small multidrug resistance family-3 protein